MGIRRWLGLDALEEDLRRIEAAKTAVTPPYDDGEVWKAIDAMEERLKTLTAAIAEGIERVDRSERRVRQVVQRARKELEESGLRHEGLEAEAEQLQFLDGGRSGSEGVHPVSAPVEDPPHLDLSAFPGQWGDADVAQLLRARG